MKKIKVEQAVGMVLAHDLTKIIPGEFKGVAFKKGHVIKKDDIDELKKMGKNHINVLELKGDEYHEDEAAMIIAKSAAGEGIYLEGPSEGKVNLKSTTKGLLKVNVEALQEINAIDLIMMATIHSNIVVEKDKIVAGTRIIPLTIPKAEIKKVETICEKLGKIVSIKEMKPLKTGIVVTGSEVYEGRIKDRFGPVLVDKVKKYGGELIGIKNAPDDAIEIEKRIEELIEQGARVILTSGGMSVDADDVTPFAIRKVADKIISYGSPILPGAMFMLGYKGDISILGVPACGMYHKNTALDLVIPRIYAEEKLSKRELSALAHGGLCHGCKECHYPICPLGK